MDKCYFSNIDKCRCPDSKDVTPNGPARIQTIIKCSKRYDDGLHEELEKRLESDSGYYIQTHRSCVSSYTSRDKIERHLKRTGDKCSEDAYCSSAKRRRRSSTPHFNFQTNCIFCGEVCDIQKNKKNPDRWRKAYLCRTLGSTDNVKDEIIQTCMLRGDKWAGDVKVRVHGAMSDLHAADARYHVDCKAKFMTPKHVRLAATKTSNTSSDQTGDLAFERLCKQMLEDTSRVWNSVELFEQYKFQGGECLTRRTLLTSLTKQFDHDLIMLSAAGVASIVVFKATAPAILKVVNDNDEPDTDADIKRIAKHIVKECKEVAPDKKNYHIRLNKQTIEDTLSTTLMNLLSHLSEKLRGTPTAYLLGSIITNMISNFPTPLQIGLGVLMRNSKALVKQMNDFGVTCTYDEVLRFKKSAAMAATSSEMLQGISDSRDGLIQMVVDNFDADISSQNGKVSTHSLAMLVTQPSHGEHNNDNETIRRIEKSEMTNAIDYEIDIEHFSGPKKADMPRAAAERKVTPLKVLAEMAISSRRAKEVDVVFLNEVIQTESCPEFNGYNTRLSRVQGQCKKPKTAAVYLPLIDKTPSDPDTIKTAMKHAQHIAQKCGQEYTVFTGDLQLYRVALNIIWATPEQFSNVVLRLGGMHTLMSFVGSVGSLMEGSGLTELLESTFGGVLKMLSGKKFPQNVRALRMLSEELLREIFTSSAICCARDFDNVLADLSAQSRTCKLWIDCVIRAVLIMMMYIRAERESDWCLHLVAIKAMIPYFFAAGHVHYARYSVYYVRSMEEMPRACQEKFLKGEHVMRHIPGVWNGIWSDMFIETTFMRYGHGKQGIIGITLKPDTLKIWSLGLHICSKFEEDIVDLTSINMSSGDKHKEEMSARIVSDTNDRKSLQEALKDCLHPLNPSNHPVEIVNVVTGQVAPETVNVDHAIEIGTKQMKEFECGWPISFHETISRKVKTQAETRKCIKIGETKVFDTELIFTRVVGIQASSREFDLMKLLTYELAPVPTSMFTDCGAMRVAKGKSVLKRMMKVDVSVRTASRQMETMIIDGSAVLYVIRWPSIGTVGDFVLKFRRFIECRLAEKDVYVVFDRYMDYSTKGVTRESRGSRAHRVHQLSTAMQIPSQKAILSVSENKAQLIALIVSDLCSNISFPENVSSTRKLVVTGADEVPTEVTPTVSIRRHDMRTTHEEADNIIAQQMIAVAKEKPGGLVVLSDDTDVFVLLLYHYQQQNLTNKVVMESPVQDRSAIDIMATVNQNRDIIPDLPAAYALSGSDTTACCFGIGKGTALKVLKSGGISLTSVGDQLSNMLLVQKESTHFIAKCFNVAVKNESMSTVRQMVWSSKVGRTASCAPKIASLPPTTESFFENVKRAHLQACIWKHAVDADPPDMDPTYYGWEKKEVTRSMVPVMLPPNTPMAPDDIMKLIKCSCESATPCNTLRCRCNSARLSCTMFCKCQGKDACCNAQTQHAVL